MFKVLKKLKVIIEVNFLQCIVLKLENLVTLKFVTYLGTDSGFLQALSSDELLDTTHDYEVYPLFEVKCEVHRRDARYPKIQIIRYEVARVPK